jgi:hypothetical protein
MIVPAGQVIRELESGDVTIAKGHDSRNVGGTGSEKCLAERSVIPLSEERGQDDLKIGNCTHGASPHWHALQVAGLAVLTLESSNSLMEEQTATVNL